MSGDTEWAVGIVAGAVLFMAWHGVRWSDARHYWRQAQKEGRDMPAPRFMEGVAENLASWFTGIAAFVDAALPLAFGVVGLFAVTAFVVTPLVPSQGVMAWLAGAVVYAAYTMTYIAMLTRVGEDRRRAAFVQWCSPTPPCPPPITGQPRDVQQLARAFCQADDAKRRTMAEAPEQGRGPRG